MWSASQPAKATGAPKALNTIRDRWRGRGLGGGLSSIRSVLNALPANDQQQLNRHNFLNYWSIHGCPTEKSAELENPLAEAWTWLERVCLVALRPNAGGSRAATSGRTAAAMRGIHAGHRPGAAPGYAANGQ
jgi:hypothetical protein